MSSREREVQVRVAEGGERLDRVVARALGVSRRIARTLIATGRVSINGRTTRILTRPVRAGSEVRVAAPQPEERREARPTLDVLFSDRYIIVVNKPPGLLAEHDCFGSPSLEALVPAWLRARGERDRVWLVHRLDAGTSGVIVLARTPMAVARLGEQFRRGAVRKTYLALCAGRLEGAHTIDAPIARAARTKHVVSPAGKPALTHVVSLAATASASLVRAEPRTGRTHQIRVHLAHLGHPLLGDRLYGGPVYTPAVSPSAVGRPMLHAAHLAFSHPKSGAEVSFAAPLPADFVHLAEQLGVASALLGASR